ncbi:MAG: hypothetical protein HFF62_07160 [Oscillospiraceae bacterium]|jgi:hypothetical protein|nr:hypothetical protein [Oscillospiraceae bacterium]
MDKLRYTFKTDTLFKMLLENIEQFAIRNPDMLPEVLGGEEVENLHTAT